MHKVAQWFWRRVDDVSYKWNADRPRFWRNLVVGAGVSLLGYSMIVDTIPTDDTKFAWVNVALAVIGIGLSTLAASMLPDQEDPLDRPTTLATRGVFTPWFVGIREVGPVFTYAGEREVRKEAACGGKGKGLGGAPDAEINYESGMHVIGVGPVTKLYSIKQSGKHIFNGHITNESHPSGTTVDLGKEGSFTIYWGENGQPINTFLGNANRIGISSRWPGICYIQWNKKRMTGQAWPPLKYTVERRPTYSGLTVPQTWYEPGRTLTGGTDSVVAVVASATETTGYLEVSGDRTARYKPNNFIELAGVGMPNGTYQILKAETELVPSGPAPFFTYTLTTRIFLQDGTAGATATGTVQAWVRDSTDGANIAAVIGELLFESWPQGLGLNPDHIAEPWDIDSLEALGVEAETEEWRASIYGGNGETAESLLGSMLQDHGTMLPFDTSTGKMLFQRVRFPGTGLDAVIEDIYADKFPEIETLHDDNPVDRLVFVFTDRLNRFEEMTIQIDEDGQASRLEHQRARKVPIVSTVNFDTAASLSELRAPEELASGASIKLSVAREARDLLPGQAVTVEGLDPILRVTSVGIDPGSERVSVTVIPDFYGVPMSTFETGGPLRPPAFLDPEPDEAFFWAEIPEQLLADGFGDAQSIMVPRIRANDQITFSSIHLSSDDSTYVLKVQDVNVQTGGTLDAELAASGPQFVSLGPVFTELGPDNANAADYSADLSSWGLGRQLAIIHSTAGVEICFVQKTTIVSGSQRRLDGLLRSRYDTRRLTHPAGSVVYILNSEAITDIQDGLLEPSLNLWVKSQPGTAGGQVNLSSIGPFGQPIVGKGQVPITPDYVHVTAPFKSVPAYQTGDDVTVSWAVSTGTVSTGAGGQSESVAVGPAVIPGTIQIELLNTSDVVQSTVSVDGSTIDYQFTNAALIAALGSEQDFKVRVTHIANGHSSGVSPSLTIEFI